MWAIYAFNKYECQQIRSLFFNPPILVQGCGWPEPFPVAQGARQEPSLDRMTFITGCTHTQSVWANWDTPVYLTCIALRHGCKLEDLEKTHTAMRIICKLHTDSVGRELIFFINIRTKQYSMKWQYSRPCGIQFRSVTASLLATQLKS